MGMRGWSRRRSREIVLSKPWESLKRERKTQGEVPTCLWERGSWATCQVIARGGSGRQTAGKCNFPLSSLKNKRSGRSSGAERKVRTTSATQEQMDKRFLFIAGEGKLWRVLEKKWMVNENQLVVITYLSCVKHHWFLFWVLTCWFTLLKKNFQGFYRPSLLYFSVSSILSNSPTVGVF